MFSFFKKSDKPSEQKEITQVEKKVLSRSFTQPKGTEEYQVKAADTLAGIAARFDTTPSELAKLNRLNARLIFPGQLLFVPEKKSTSESDSASETQASKENGGSNQDNKGGVGEQDDNSLSVEGMRGKDGELPPRKVSVTDALRIPYRRQSERMQRFLKVKARHFTDGQGVVAGVLIITPNAVMFDPHVSDPLVIEHGTESYGVIAPLDMLMRTAIYFDIAHMKVKNAPDTQLIIPKADVYYGKMTTSPSSSSEKDTCIVPKTADETSRVDVGEPKAEPSADNSVETNILEPLTASSQEETKPSSELAEQVQAVELDVEDVGQDANQDVEVKVAEIISKDDALEVGSSDLPPEELSATESKPGPKTDHSPLGSFLTREASVDREVSEAFSGNPPRTLGGGPPSANSSVGSPTPPPTQNQGTEGGEKPTESRRERMFKRLSYPMESITSYTHSSISRILSSSPKSFVDFSSGLFVRNSEEEKGKEDDLIQEQSEEDNKGDPEETPKEPEAEPVNVQEQQEPIQEKSERAEMGYKNLVEEKPEIFAVLDELLRQNAAQEQEGPPLYLCLRMGIPKVRKVQMSTPILSYGKKRAKSEYWFSIPHNRVDDLYNFLQQWIPQLYGDVDEVDPDSLGFMPIDDSTEDEEEEEKETDGAKGGDSAEGNEENSNPRSFLKLVEDTFGFRSISPTDWEVLSMSEDKISYFDLELPLPELLSPSEIFQEEHIKELYTLLPARAVGYPWTLIFSTSTNGFNLKTLYRRMASYDTPVLLALADTEGAVFGALLSSPVRQSDHFYGTGESFLYTFYPEFKLYKWTGDNTYFVKGDAECIAIGAGDGHFGIWLDGDINHGTSTKCQTFGNEVLSKTEDFVIKTLEAWGFV